MWLHIAVGRHPTVDTRWFCRVSHNTRQASLALASNWQSIIIYRAHILFALNVTQLLNQWTVTHQNLVITHNSQIRKSPTYSLIQNNCYIEPVNMLQNSAYYYAFNILYNTLFSREEIFAKNEFEIFSREEIFANILFTRKYLPAKISSRENFLPRKFLLAKISFR